MVWTSSTAVEGEIVLDNSKNVYAYTEDELLKFNTKGEVQYTYSTLSKGLINSIDVSNQLRILVHFKENNEVVYLDNTLSLQGESINFNALGLYDVTLVTNSFQNHIWIFRQAEQKMVRLDKFGTKVAESSVLNMVIEDETFDFTDLSESGNFLYLTSSSGNIFVFDHYGTYQKKLSLGKTERLNFFSGEVFFQKENSIYRYNTLLHAADTIVQQESLPVGQVLVDFSREYIATQDSAGLISVYSAFNQ